MASVYHAQQKYVASRPRIAVRINRSVNSGESQNSSYRRSGNTDHKMKNQLSPLQKLQLEYQEKLQLEKEKKMTLLYEKWSNEALNRVRKHSGNRDIEKNHQVKEDSEGYTAYQKRSAVSAQQRIGYRKPQKLPPLNNANEARSFHSPAGIVNNGQRAAPRTNKLKIGHPPTSYNATENPDPKELRFTTPQEEDGHSSPPPNIQHLRLLRERKLQQKKLKLEKQMQIPEPNDPFKTRKKMTDFEKWQEEQNAQRVSRLQKHFAKQELEKSIHGFFPTNTEDVVPVAPRSDKKSHKAAKKAVAGNVSTKRSVSPMVRPRRNGQTKRQETVRQGMENEKRIAELEREMKQKQLDLIRMQEREKRSRLSSLENATSGSENGSEQELHSASSQTPILKPVKVPSKRSGQSNNSIFSGDDGESVNSEIGFQMKPVLVRRDGSRGSSRGTPQKDKTYLVRKPKIKRNPRNQTFMSPDLRIREEDEIQHHPPISPPLLTKSPQESLPAAYPLDGLEEEKVNLQLVPCGICSRKFTKDRLAKHMNVCSRTQGKKRKVFDMTKARTQGTDAEKFARRKAYMRSETPPAKKSDWRRKHEEFINTIRNAKIVQEHVAKGGKITDLPPPPPSENPDYVKCQYCERRFDPSVAERHIPRCKDIKSRPKPPKRR